MILTAIIVILVIIMIAGAVVIKEQNDDMEKLEKSLKSLDLDYTEVVWNTMKIAADNIVLKQENKKWEWKLKYARGRVTSLEIEIADITGNKKRLSWNTFKD